MAVPVRVTGAWTQLLSDWLDVHQQAAPDLRLRLDSRRPDEPVPMQLWQQMLADAVKLVPHEAAPALQIGACAPRKIECRSLYKSLPRCSIRSSRSLH